MSIRGRNGTDSKAYMTKASGHCEVAESNVHDVQLPEDQIQAEREQGVKAEQGQH
jgi:hypothetical protein